MGSSKDDFQHKSLKQIIPKLYKRQWLEGALFGYIRACKTLVPSITLEQAIQSFYKDQDISEQDFPMADCITTYTRMTKEYHDSRKSEGE